MAGAGGGGFEFCGREDTAGAGVAGGEMLLNSQLFGRREFCVDVGAECVRTEVWRDPRYDRKLAVT